MRLVALRALASCVTAALLLLTTVEAAAQDQPPGPYVIDARAAFSTVGRSDALALPRGLQASELPRHVLGLDVGAHVYPLRGKVTLGIGASYVRLGRTQTPEALDEDSPADAPVTAGTLRLTGIMPQASLNFGSSRGWSYVGAGMGLSRLTAGRAESMLESSPQLLTLHMGGGARWFVGERTAFTFDLRFYRAGAREVSGDYIGNPTVSLLVVSAGLSVR